MGDNIGRMTHVEWINPKNLLDWQRDAAFRYLGEEARRLLAEGYPVEADRLLDELAERFPDHVTRGESR